MNIGKIIKEERKKKNIKKTELAEIVGCTVRAIDYWENEKRKISFENADKILRALNITIKIGYESDWNK